MNGAASKKWRAAVLDPVPDITETFAPVVARQWREWLAANGRTKDEIWLVMYTKASGKPFVPYAEALDEALCYGWIDGVVKSLGDGARAQRYTPRRPRSNVSEMNKAHVRRLVREGRMTQAGIDALPGFHDWIEPPPLVIAADIEAALREEGAWEPFCAMSEAYRRVRTAFVETARSHPAVFEARLANLTKMTAAGKQFGGLRD